MYNSLKLGSTSGPGRNVDRVCVLVEVDLVQQSETCLYNYTDSITGQPQLKQEFPAITVPPPLPFPPAKRQFPDEIPSLESVPSGMTSQQKPRIFKKRQREPTLLPIRKRQKRAQLEESVSTDKAKTTCRPSQETAGQR